jgi:hypothetical protein
MLGYGPVNYKDSMGTSALSSLVNGNEIECSHVESLLHNYGIPAAEVVTVV